MLIQKLIDYEVLSVKLHSQIYIYTYIIFEQSNINSYIF